jgi:Rrf2 family nitric oxide-sensitive transcriptional repressor
VAQRYGISRNHLMKVTQTLVQAGLIVASAAGGGLMTATPCRRYQTGWPCAPLKMVWRWWSVFDPQHNTCLITVAGCGSAGRGTAGVSGGLDGYSLADREPSQRLVAYARRYRSDLYDPVRECTAARGIDM